MDIDWLPPQPLLQTNLIVYLVCNGTACVVFRALD